MPTRRPRILTNLRIDEVSAVDKGAGDGTRVVLAKRYEPQPDARAALVRKFTEIFSKGAAVDELDIKPEFDKPPGPDLGAVRVGVDEMTDADMANVADARTGADPGSPTAHVEALVSLICEANPAVDRASALHFLLYTAHGASLISRTVRKRKEQQMTSFNPAQSMIIAKGAPTNFVDCVAKDLITGDAFQLTIAAAKAAYPDLTEARAFAKFVEANPILQRYAFAPVGPYSYLQGEPLRKTVALEAEPQMSLTPTVAGGLGDFSGDAYEKLVELTNEQLRLKNLSTKFFAREFARIYSDPRYAQLSQQERRQNRPGGVARMAM